MKAAEALDRELSYKLFFEANPLPMWIYDRETLAFLAVNDAAASHYGYSRDEFLRMTLREIRSPQEVDHLLASVTNDEPWQMIQKGIWAHRKKSGEEILVDITTSAIPFQKRECKLALVNDITERERTRSELVEWMNRYDAAIKASGQILYDLDLTSGHVAYHGDLQAKLGYNAQELAGGLSRLVHPEDKAAFRRALEESVETKSRFALEYRVARKSGGYVSIEDIGHWVKNREGKVIRLIGFLNDVTERRSLEGQLRQSQKMDALGRLSGGIAHDFNNVLGVILGYSQLLLESGLPEEPARRIAGILQAGQRAAGLTRQLLVFSRQEVVSPRVLDINAVVANLQSMLARMVGEDVSLQVFPKANWTVKADPGQIEQVIMNLVVNARDAMPQGGTVTIDTANVDLDRQFVELRPSISEGSYVQIVVSDTGTGMDAETRTRIFEPFFTTKARGTGLGLSTVYGIVKQCGGSVSVYSEPGHGAAFKVYLPAVAESVTRDESNVTLEPDGGNETVLVAEDEIAYRELVREVLVAKGYNVLVAEDGRRALEIADKFAGNIDVLLTDSVMPSATGIALAEQMKKRFPVIKVIMMSGYTDRAITTEAASVSADLFLQKPFTTTMLLSGVRQVLEKS